MMDKLEEQGNPNEELLNHMVLNDVIQTLHEEERILIRLRYFEDKTQMEVARALGMSQVQVSRYEKKILKKMRGRIS